VIDEKRILDAVTRLSRRHQSGGTVIERAAINAEGAMSQPILAWILTHGGKPEAVDPRTAARGLHGDRLNGSISLVASAPRRYVLPPGALS
jgi:hypothetical protein